MKIRYATFCEAGLRQVNEDCIGVASIPGQDRTMFILCDGMGGHANGSLASKIITDVFVNYWVKRPEFKDCSKKVLEACHKASVKFDRVSFDHMPMQMGSTMVLASIEGNKITIAHIGDSRCYLLRRSKKIEPDSVSIPCANADDIDVIYQTEDHVDVQKGWDVVSRCFFSFRPEEAVPDIRQYELYPGDVIFLCSDGVNKYIRPDIMKARLMDERTPEEIAEVIKFLCEKDSLDNYTGIVVQVQCI